VPLRLELTDTRAGSASAKSFSFDEGPVTVGRSSTCNVLVEGNLVSRSHVILELAHGAWSATHLGSMAPTLLNGRELPPNRPTRLSDGDVLQIVHFRLKVGIPQESEIPCLDPLASGIFQGESQVHVAPPVFQPEPAAPPPPVAPPAPVVFTPHPEPPRPASPARPAPAPRFEPAPPPTPVPAPAREDAETFVAPSPRAVHAPPGPAGRAVPTLSVRSPGFSHLRLELHEVGRDYRIGRSSANDLSIASGAVSRQHAIVRFDGNRLTVRDAGARNPVVVNGRPIAGEIPVQNGDVIAVGGVEIDVLMDSGPGDLAGASGMFTIPIESGAPAPRAVAPPPAAPAAPAWSPEPSGAPAWQPEPSAAYVPPPAAAAGPLPPLPPTPPASAAPAAPVWTPDPTQVVQKPPAAPPPVAPPPAPAWQAAPPAAWEPPPAAAPAAAPPAAAGAPPPVAPPPPAPPPVAPPPPQAPPPSPPPAAAAAAPAAPAVGGAEPRIRVKRAATGKGWLVTGLVTMTLAVVVGLIVLIAALASSPPA
jgi:pSer/pThr/pTyr-binding forkhead associated (FHA) protein